jgi:sporulation protein YlmC with PRC-barrel domain
MPVGRCNLPARLGVGKTVPLGKLERSPASLRRHRSDSAYSLFTKETVMAEQMTKITEEITKITSGSLIAAKKVLGTDVYNMQGEKLGTVEDIMIDKVSGKAIYAVMSFGGFLGIGEKYHPLPWSTLTYDESKGGYVVNLDKKMLENAPTYSMDQDFLWTPEYGRQVDKYYNAPTYWS